MAFDAYDVLDFGGRVVASGTPDQIVCALLPLCSKPPAELARPELRLYRGPGDVVDGISADDVIAGPWAECGSGPVS
ncbi:hypothetical protein R5W24_004467 [Gemmata sp. JC717]|uniref:hypothetical protein n=1 Tax=Gemmata algarum TaxID=2975278 RepID=UPI0021BB383C|nr:hypothetical protein [Gemmata algarum]MDY3555325.1 hypothetical protein [Gemmata algarum]